MPHMLPIPRPSHENACVAVTGEHDAHPPRIQMELLQVGEAIGRMHCDRHAELETLKSIRRRDDHVRSSRRIEPRAYQRQLVVVAHHYRDAVMAQGLHPWMLLAAHLRSARDQACDG